MNVLAKRHLVLAMNVLAKRHCALAMNVLPKRHLVLAMNVLPNRHRLVATVVSCLAAVSGGCLSVQAGDLFLLTRTGVEPKLTLLVNDGGTVRCNGGAVKPLPDKLLLQARDLANTLDNDAKNRLALPRTANTVAMYTVKLKDGTISFPDTAARAHSEVAQLELLTVQIAQGPCGLSG